MENCTTGGLSASIPENSDLEFNLENDDPYNKYNYLMDMDTKNNDKNDDIK